MPIDRDFFLKAVNPLFYGSLSPSQEEGIMSIFSSWERNKGADPRWLAYMFATSYHETNRRMKAVREAYWLSESWRKQNLPYYPYYGRGHVQLTHKENYQKTSMFFNEDFVANPDIALSDRYSPEIMFVGMKDGWFRRDNSGVPHTLGRYFSNVVNDPVGARKIINGKEVKIVAGKKKTVAEIIKSYYDVFLDALRQTSPIIVATIDAPVLTQDIASELTLATSLHETAPTGSSEIDGVLFAATGSPPIVAISDPVQGTRDTEVLLSLAASVNLQTPARQLIDFRNAHRPHSNPQHWAILDFNKASFDERLHIFDIESETVSSYLCAHGKGSEGQKDDGMAVVFSNKDGSNCSSLGIYLCNETYMGDNGYSMRLDGMQPTNSNARHRAIVVHGADYVSREMIANTGRIGRSLGCPAVERRHTREIIDMLKRGSLLYAWKSS